MFNSRNVALALGFTFIAVTVLGFIPNPLVSPHGLFAVNLAHNLVHLITGLGFIVSALVFAGREDRVIKVIGGLYFLVAIIGFFTRGDMLLGIIHINQADRWLHLGLAVAILFAGYLFRPETDRVA
ncbi:MAG: DUF4383 domain-containing protein [Zhongshania sp.]|uniref:DUF4383 domain-containing protein n=1 Tax=Zhongshania sp. TaxID=1971902 RepID=UPI0026346079|nr:DUF4383 domain-containing protein [Zhongshania sp.]MDF1693334.1 DUF4383 domain-containing protein [Zhongshania sp.]